MRNLCKSKAISWLWSLLFLFSSIAGCSPQKPKGEPSLTDRGKEVVSVTPVTFEVAAEDLLKSRLAPEEAAEGWVRLFDNHTLFGWEIASKSNWRVEDQSIVVDSGEAGLLCTSIAWADYELRLEFKADASTNSGVFLRTPLQPSDPAADCYEVNIAPSDNPFPSGSLVKRAKVVDGQPGSATSPLDATQWHVLEMTVIADEVTIALDGKQTCKYRDPKQLPAGRIGLQHNSGKVAFRDIRIRPVGLKPLLDKSLSLWKRYPQKPGEFVVNETGELRVTGGRGQVESLESFGNFVALVEGKTQSEKLNSGLFFRCMPGSDMNGYECQINHGVKDNNPLSPLDCGTGGIFRRQDARIVAAEDKAWFTLLLVADGLQFAAWVNGLQVTDCKDTRSTNENPRNGSRLEAGTLMLQAHDPTTDILFRKVNAVELKPAEPGPIEGE